jgi:hypothetical protein
VHALELLALAALVVPSHAVAASPARIELVAKPAQLELRPGARAVLRISADEEPVLVANVGHLSGLRVVGPRRFEAIYEPPGESIPDVAIIAATTSRGFGWLALPLAGTGEVQVKTEPRANATVTIRGRRFGPVRADAEGRAVIPIVVPPGTRYALFQGRRMDLGVPAVARPYAVIDRSGIAANVSTTVTLRVLVVTADGRPRQRAPLRLEVSSGSISAPHAVEPGVFVASWRLPAAAPGEASVSAWIAGEPGAAAYATVIRREGAPGKRDVEQEGEARAERSTLLPRKETRPSRPAPAPPPPPPAVVLGPAPERAPAPPAIAASPAAPPAAPSATMPPRPPVTAGGIRPARVSRDALSPDATFELRTGVAFDRDGLRALVAGAQLSWFPVALGRGGLGLDTGGLAVRQRAPAGAGAPELAAVSRIFTVQGLALLRTSLLGGTGVVGVGGGAAYGLARTAATSRPVTESSAWVPAYSAVASYGHRLGAGSLGLDVRFQHVGAIGEQRFPGALDLVGLAVGYRLDLF